MGGSPHTSLTPKAIIDAAERMVINADTIDWSLRSLSRDMGCAPGALIRHFPNGADAIFDAVRVRESVRLRSWIVDAEESPETPVLANLAPYSNGARLMRRCCAYLDFAEVHPAVYRHLFGQPPGTRAGSCEVVVGTMIEYHASLIQAAARARELDRPIVGRTEAMRIAHRIWVALHGYADLKLSGMAREQVHEPKVSRMVGLLFLAGFVVAATPAGLEAAARAATGNGARHAAMINASSRAAGGTPIA